MYCQMCGAGMPDDADFCAQCGARRPQAPGEAPATPGFGAPQQPPQYGAPQQQQPQYGAPQPQPPYGAPPAYGQAAYGQQPQYGGQPPAGQWGAPYYDATQSAPRYFYASFWPRFGAWLLDVVFVLLLSVIPSTAFGVLFYQAAEEDTTFSTLAEQDEQDEDEALAIAGGVTLGFLPVWLGYNIIANAKGGGWGKRIVGIRIVKERDGTAPGWGKGIGRTMIRVPILFINIAYIIPLLDCLWSIWDQKKQTWHDKVAGTIVIEK